MVLPGIGAVGVTRLSSSSFVFCPFVPEDILICVGTDSSNVKRGPLLQVFLLIDERKNGFCFAKQFFSKCSGNGLAALEIAMTFYFSKKNHEMLQYLGF